MNIYYLGEIDFKSGQAACVRVINNCKAINNCNDHCVTIFGIGNQSIIDYEGFKVLNVRRGKSKFLKLIYSLLRPILFIRLIKKQTCKPDILIYYGASALILLPLLMFCRISGVKLITDIVEWYDYNHLPLGKYGPKALDVHLAMTQVIPKCDGVIAISSYLYNYYKNKGMKMILVPILIDSHFKQKSSNIFMESNSLNLIYAGYAGKKDLIINAIEAVEQVNQRGYNVKFHILGQNKSHLHQMLSDNIIFYGKLPYETVQSYLKVADFSVLLRPDKRYAHAGFPTKFVESMNMGLPVLANLTSDLGKYLRNGENGFIVSDYSVQGFVNILKKISEIDRKIFQEMKTEARKTAINSFDFRDYYEPFKHFLSNSYEKN